MEKQLAELPAKAKEFEGVHRKFFKTLKHKPPKYLDTLMAQLHDATFKTTDCLQCANCCKTTGPLFTDKDITRISKHLRLKPSVFIAKYLRVDEDQDYVLQELPCSFLDTDNYCLIYEVRPKACREYPHTNQRNFHKITSITQKNLAICPAAFEIVEALRARLTN